MLAYLALNEFLEKNEIIAMISSFLLIMMLFISRQASQGPPVFNAQPANTSNIWIGLFFAVSSAMGASVAAVATRRM